MGNAMTRTNLFSTALIACTICLSTASSIVLADNGIYRDRADISVPESGMTMEQVKAKYGAADSALPSVGNPPITRWEYDGFTVYFEYQRVIHSVIS